MVRKTCGLTEYKVSISRFRVSKLHLSPPKAAIYSIIKIGKTCHDNRQAGNMVMRYQRIKLLYKLTALGYKPTSKRLGVQAEISLLRPQADSKN